jgi:uncharacterized protein YukE
MRAMLEQVGPGRWLLPPMPAGDAEALRRLAADWRELAELLDTEAQRASGEIARLQRDWAGPGSLAAPVPLRRLVDDTATVCRALRTAAEQAETLATAMQASRDRHDWSWRKATAIGAVVVVSAAAVVVTVGTAGAASPGAAAAETAAVGAAAAEMAAASTAAVVARAAAARGLLAVAQLTRAVEVARAVVVPRLVLASMQAPIWIETPIGAGVTSGAIAAGLDLVDDEDGVDWLSVAFSTLVGAGEVYAISPGRSRGFRAVGARDHERMERPRVRAELVRLARESWRQTPRSYYADPSQLEDHYKHAWVLGLDRQFNLANARAYDVALREFVMNQQTVRIVGGWRGAPAVIYADYDANIAVVTRPSGEFWTVVAPGPGQRWHLWYRYSLGGG